MGGEEKEHVSCVNGVQDTLYRSQWNANLPHRLLLEWVEEKNKES